MEELKPENWRVPPYRQLMESTDRADYPYPPSAFSGGYRYVYIIVQDETGPVKIGIARDPFKRLAQLQTGSPSKLKLVSFSKPLTDKQARAAERDLHAQLASHRMSGEWFSFYGSYPYVYASYEGLVDITDFVFDPSAVNRALS